MWPTSTMRPPRFEPTTSPVTFAFASINCLIRNQARPYCTPKTRENDRHSNLIPATSLNPTQHPAPNLPAGNPFTVSGRTLLCSSAMLFAQLGCHEEIAISQYLHKSVAWTHTGLRSGNQQHDTDSFKPLTTLQLDTVETHRTQHMQHVMSQREQMEQDRLACMAELSMHGQAFNVLSRLACH